MRVPTHFGRSGRARLDAAGLALMERRELFATLTRRWERTVCRLGMMATVVVAGGILAQPALAKVRFASKQAAFTQGYSAYKSQQYEIAVPALEFASGRGVMRAKFFLAKIYSDNSGGKTNHARAYGLLREIVTEYSDVDPSDPRVAPFVSQALTSIARYERDGLPEIGLKPSTKRALVFFNHAAAYFNDADAQFELAKHYLAGDGVETRVPFALNWLARLSKRGHAGAQAFLANLYWDGRYTLRDPVKALALITVAVENASDEDRFWIEDVHQNIFCETDDATRIRVHQVIASWRGQFGRPERVGYGQRRQAGDGLGNLAGDTQRTCSNGDIVGVLKKRSDASRSLGGGAVSSQVGPDADGGGMLVTRMRRPQGAKIDGPNVMQGGASGLSLSIRPRGN